MRDVKVHLRHCDQGEYIGSCKYGEDDNCAALIYKAIMGNKEDKMSKSDREFERRLDLAKEDLYEALKESTSVLKLTLQLMMTPQGERAMNSMIEQNERALAKVEKPYKETKDED